MRASRSLLQRALAVVVFFFLAACGGSGGSDGSSSTSTSDSLTATIRIATTAPATAVVLLDGSGSITSAGGALTYNWTLTSKPAGSAATIDNPAAVQPLLTTDLVGTYAVTLAVADGIKTTTTSASVTTTAFTPPTIISDVVEPLSGTVQLALAGDPGSTGVAWTVDGVSLGSGATIPWDTTTVANGPHVVVAQLQFLANYTISVSRTFQVNQSPISFFTPMVFESLGQFTAFVGVTSANGILRVDGTLDGVPFSSLVVPNSCFDPAGVACATSPPNGFAFSGTVSNGAHVVVVTVTDGIGKTLGIQLRFTVTDAP